MRVGTSAKIVGVGTVISSGVGTRIGDAVEAAVGVGVRVTAGTMVATEVGDGIESASGMGSAKKGLGVGEEIACGFGVVRG